ncbi:MAG TPA: CPCC family cysteine-rich protein [Ktedonobacteraceae bacterium]|nr:CPCC family cysteine-rich protein [Ktedonobacteraceae bacterium]
MPSQSRDAAIVNELFQQNQHMLDSERSSAVYDEAGHLIKLSLHEDRRYESPDEPDFLVFPTHFHQLAHLRELYIYATLGPFPKSICQLANLQAFVLSDFSYPVEAFPAEFAQLTKLRCLGLGELHWERIPPVIWQLRNLRVLDLSWNSLTSLPPEIGQLTRLRFLYLDGNHLDQLPVEIGQLTELEILHIWPHKLQTLPDEIGRLHKLFWLSLSSKLVEDPALPYVAHEMGMFIDTTPPYPLLSRAPTQLHMSHYPCQCCGYLIIENEYDICPICFWEADGSQASSPSSTGANSVCLIEARLNFARASVSEDRFLTNVRQPRPEEIPDEKTRRPHMNFQVLDV